MFTELPVKNLLDLCYLAPLPVVARERIKERFRIDDIEGYAPDCQGLKVIRDLAAEIDPDERYRHAIFLTACHTHWDENRIVESFDANSGLYLNGPVKDIDPKELRPYSFAFSRHGPLPVEWMDDTVPVNDSELDQLYRWICELNEKVAEQLIYELPTPVGLMIDHRFKRSLWEPRIFSFAEGDSQEFAGRARIIPIFESIVDPSPAIPNTVQVAWSAFGSDYFSEVPSTNKQELEFFRSFEEAIAAQPAMRARDFADAVEELLSTAQDSSDE